MSEWIRLEPERELDGTIWAQRLVIEFSNDWQSWDISSMDGGGVRFSVHIPQEWADELHLPSSDPPPA